MAHAEERSVMLKKSLSVLMVSGALLGLAILGPGPAAAQEREHHVPPAIVTPANGSVVSNPVTVTFGFGGAGGEAMAPSGQENPEHHGHGGHLVLFIDAPPPEPGTPVPADAGHVAFPDGQRQVTVTLAPGEHRLRLVGVDREGMVGRHLHASEEVTVVVR
jgi:hypothetical protein